MKKDERIILGMCCASLNVDLERNKFGEKITDESFDLIFNISQKCDCSSETKVRFVICTVKELENIKDRIQVLINEQKERENALLTLKRTSQ